MSPLITFLTAASRKASRLVYRDYFELEQIQNSVRPATEFALRSEKKIMELLTRELSKYPNSTVTIADNNNDFPSKIIEYQKLTTDSKYNAPKEIHFVISPIDGLENLTRAIPFFAVIILAYETKNSTTSPIASVVNMPALGEIIYASKGSGAWMERNMDQTSNNAIRLRVSMTSKIEQAMLISDVPDHSINLDQQRSIGCNIYSACLVGLGKADIFLASSKVSDTVITTSELIIKESGGNIYKNRYLKNKEYPFIATNAKIII